jgi:hypothetical protein
LSARFVTNFNPVLLFSFAFCSWEKSKAVK